MRVVVCGSAQTASRYSIWGLWRACAAYLAMAPSQQKYDPTRKEYFLVWDTGSAVQECAANRRALRKKPDLIIAFPGAEGTQDLIRRAAKIPVYRVAPKQRDDD